MHTLLPASPVEPLAAYVGGKRRLAKLIVERISAIPHDIYCEPFVGMGGIFLRRPQAARSEVINDGSRDVANFFRILQRHYPQLMDTLKYQVTSRAEFERLVQAVPDTLTDLERAARFLYLQRLSFGGKVAGRTFGVDPARPARFNINVLGPRLDEVHERLAGVTIECLDFEEFITRYDRPGTLCYCDPPYIGSEGYYGRELYSPVDHARLAKVLAWIKGQFLLSINDCPEAREIFKQFEFEVVRTSYSVSGGSKMQVQELLISGGRTAT